MHPNEIGGYIGVLFMRVMAKVPIWPLHPEAWAVNVNGPDPELLSPAIVPCMVRVFVDVVSDAVHDIEMANVRLFKVPVPI
jgi:hypothetical protein